MNYRNQEIIFDLKVRFGCLNGIGDEYEWFGSSSTIETIKKQAALYYSETGRKVVAFTRRGNKVIRLDSIREQ